MQLFVGHPQICACEKSCRERKPSVFVRLENGKCVRAYVVLSEVALEPRLRIWRQGKRVRVPTTRPPGSTHSALLEVRASAIVDDTGNGTHLLAPQVATRSAQIMLAWGDPRSGYGRVRLATGD